MISILHNTEAGTHSPQWDVQLTASKKGLTIQRDIFISSNNNFSMSWFTQLKGCPVKL